MARPSDPKSVRQQAFKLLKTLTDVKREKVLKILEDTFSIGKSYSATLYAAHRTINKENGTMVQVYKVKDIRDGKAVKPYIKITSVFDPPVDAALNARHAKHVYEMELKHRITLSKELT